MSVDRKVYGPLVEAMKRLAASNERIAIAMEKLADSRVWSVPELEQEETEYDDVR